MGRSSIDIAERRFQHLAYQCRLRHIDLKYAVSHNSLAFHVRLFHRRRCATNLVSKGLSALFRLMPAMMHQHRNNTSAYTPRYLSVPSTFRLCWKAS